MRLLSGSLQSIIKHFLRLRLPALGLFGCRLRLNCPELRQQNCVRYLQIVNSLLQLVDTIRQLA